jgi:hypothetical protein
MLAVCALIPASAFGWGAATHAWFARELGNQFGTLNMEEMYGSMLPDLPNYMVDQSQAAFLFQKTHYEFMAFVNKAQCLGDISKASAYGFASHNEAWGADFTAHIDGINTGDGYVIAKSTPVALYISGILGRPADDPLVIYLAHSAVEFGVDLRVKRQMDTQIGARMLLSAVCRSPQIPLLLVSAYARDFAAATGMSYLKASAILLKTEADFRQLLMLYAGVLSKPATNDEDIMALAQLGVQLISEQSGITLPQAALENILVYVTEGSNILDDYQDELNKTLTFVDAGLSSQGIETAKGIFALWKPVGTEEQSGQPASFLLKQNFPNPFNPKTTIEYVLPGRSSIRLSIYNSLGQEIALLVNGEQTAGIHTVTWDGSDFSSGTYFCRMEANGFTAVRRMQLLK